MNLNAIDPSKIELSTIDPRLVREMLIMNELYKVCPPTTAARAAARHQADEELRVKYPGQYVAYVESWSGEELNREVVAASADWEEYQAQLNKVPLEVRNRVEIDRIETPQEREGIFGGARVL